MARKARHIGIVGETRLNRFSNNGPLLIEPKAVPPSPEASGQLDVFEVVAAGMNPQFNQITEIRDTEESSVTAQLAESW